VPLKLFTPQLPLRTGGGSQLKVVLSNTSENALPTPPISALPCATGHAFSIFLAFLELQLITLNNPNGSTQLTGFPDT
jgi:hypothetical protein